MNEPKKPYEPPAIIYRAELEATATACGTAPSQDDATACPIRAKGDKWHCDAIAS